MYEQRITRAHRTAIVLVVDCSTSMQEMTTINNLVMPKAEAIAFASNYLIDELMALATRYDGLRDYYDIAIIGYSGDGVESLLPADGFNSIAHLATIAPEKRDFTFICKDVVDEDCSTTYAIRPWVDAKATGSTPMFEALAMVADLVEKWCNEPTNRQSFPPMVFNISDGEPTDGTIDELISIAERIKHTATKDGNTLLFNIHLGNNTAQHPVTFPCEYNYTSECPHQNMLFRMSSLLPEGLESALEEQRADHGPYRCVAFNASFGELMSILNIGSESVKRN
ncbi:MAG: VWA domain-containing protein [Alistipes sp.]|nr:VWA domain-containing protein [Alistipes sp.]MBQ8775412.1 VWA domain-containing protein [Alistipes sp.]